MKKFKSFYFESYSFDSQSLIAKFEYSFDNEYFFTEEIDFSSDKFNLNKNIDYDILDNFLFSLHIALGISYYKAYPTKKLYIKSWYLSKTQISFWQKFYKNWLGEFLYTNNIDPSWLFEFENTIFNPVSKVDKDFDLRDKSLIPLWWWKDSLVSIDLYSKSDYDYDLYVFWKNDSIKQNCADLLNKDILLTKRKICPNLIHLNEIWNYNWHVPITWIIAFVIITVWYLYNYKYLVLSNERSANSWNTVWNSIDVNHQWSKSLEFESDFMHYVRENLSKNIYYFSLLRWFYEYKIAEYFSNNCKRFFWVFSSCNNNFKIDEKKRLKSSFWCNSCPKCAFSFSILRPFLNNQEILSIFWEDLFYKKELESTFIELLWIEWIKPFECVWEKEEVVLAFYKSYFYYDNKPNILKIFESEVINKNDNQYFDNLEKRFWTIYDEDIIPLNIKSNVLKI